MDRDCRREEEILHGKINPGHRTLFLESRPSLFILWPVRGMPLATHPLCHPGRIEERDPEGDHGAIGRMAGNSLYLCSPFPGSFWLPGQSPVESRRRIPRFLSGEIAP